MPEGASALGAAAQLSLFDTASPAVPAPPPQPSPPLLRHPDAARELLLGGHVVGYALRRARRRSIGFTVGAEGLAVAAPRWVSRRDIEAALREKAQWILAKLAEQQERAQRLRAARVDWRDGARIAFLGRPMTIALGAPVDGAMLDPGAPGEGSARLLLGLPPQAGAEQIRDAVQSWLQRQARRIFDERCAHFASRLQVTVRRVALSSAQTRWGSASADGSVRLNWRLVHFGLPTIDYVVAHELAHLRHMNHGPEFWDVVGSVVPDVKAARERLRAALLPALE